MIVLLMLLAVASSFLVSASAGLGGSLILVPALALVLDAKRGVALAALLLAANNVAKTFAYRKTIPLRPAAVIIVVTAIGSYIGARLLIEAPERAVTVAVMASFAVALLAERIPGPSVGRALGPIFAFAGGATSGFSGTSGPLKGIAVRSLRVDRQHFVGAASLASLVGDATKTATYTEAGLLGREDLLLALALIPVMIAATLAGRRFNSGIGERGHAALFWAVMGGYTFRLLAA